eukprot:3018488-Amphidinium_carterae.4
MAAASTIALSFVSVTTARCIGLSSLGETEKEADRQTETETETETDKDKQTDRQTDGQPDRQTDGQPDRQANKKDRRDKQHDRQTCLGEVLCETMDSSHAFDGCRCRRAKGRRNGCTTTRKCASLPDALFAQRTPQTRCQVDQNGRITKRSSWWGSDLVTKRGRTMPNRIANGRAFVLAEAELAA